MNKHQTRKALQKISSENPSALSAGDKKLLKKLSSVLKKASKDKSLSAYEKQLIKEIIKKSDVGLINAPDIINLMKVIFHLGDLIKDYT